MSSVQKRVPKKKLLNSRESFAFYVIQQIFNTLLFYLFARVFGLYDLRVDNILSFEFFTFYCWVILFNIMTGTLSWIIAFFSYRYFKHSVMMEGNKITFKAINGEMIKFPLLSEYFFFGIILSSFIYSISMIGLIMNWLNSDSVFVYMLIYLLINVFVHFCTRIFIDIRVKKKIKLLKL